MKFIAVSALLILLATYASACRGSPNPYPTIDAQFAKVASHQFG
jgi:hypothetical protein